MTTEKRIEMVRLLQAARQDDEPPGDTIIRALGKLAGHLERLDSASGEAELLRVTMDELKRVTEMHRDMCRVAGGMVDALKPFADLAGKLDGAPNLVGLLTEADFQRAKTAWEGAS